MIPWSPPISIHQASSDDLLCPHFTAAVTGCSGHICRYVMAEGQVCRNWWGTREELSKKVSIVFFSLYFRQSAVFCRGICKKSAPKPPYLLQICYAHFVADFGHNYVYIFDSDSILSAFITLKWESTFIHCDAS